VYVTHQHGRHLHAIFIDESTSVNPSLNHTSPAWHQARCLGVELQGRYPASDVIIQATEVSEFQSSMLWVLIDRACTQRWLRLVYPASALSDRPSVFGDEVQP